MSDPLSYDQIRALSRDDLEREYRRLRDEHRDCRPHETFWDLRVYVLPFTLLAASITLTYTLQSWTIGLAVLTIASAAVAADAIHHRFKKWWDEGGEFVSTALAYIGSAAGVPIGWALAHWFFTSHL
jgi:general stress protein CsbA